MAWSGYFAIGDGGEQVEIVNVARTEAYALNAGLPWFKPAYRSGLLPALLNDAEYVTPADDGAPWYDPDEPVSNEFFGFYPTNVTGLEDSTRESDTMESTNDGGIPGRTRNATKTPVFSGVLIAASARGAEYGFRWLCRATAMRPCMPGSRAADFNGSTLHYLSLDPSAQSPCIEWAAGVRALGDGGTAGVDVDTPVVDGGTPTLTGTLTWDGGSPSETGGMIYSSTWPFLVAQDYAPPLTTYQRFMRKFKVTNGPKVSAKHDKMTGGGSAWNVIMTAVAGTPWEHGSPTVVLHLEEDTVDPYTTGAGPGIYDLDPVVHVDEPCPQQVWAPIYNPSCSPVTAPPTVPIVASECFVLPANWSRRSMQIPKKHIPLWADAVPVLTVKAPEAAEDFSIMRLQFYADLSDTGVVADNQCALVADYVIDYIPAGSTLVFDAVAEAIYVTDPDYPGVQRRADSLVANSDGLPFSWPQLSCGYGYILTVDLVDDTTVMPVIDLALVPRAS